MLLGWNLSTTILSNSNITSHLNNQAEQFRITYSKVGDKDWTRRIEVNATSTEILLTDLEADTEYIFSVLAENSAGVSQLSRPRIGRTYGINLYI